MLGESGRFFMSVRSGIYPGGKFRFGLPYLPWGTSQLGQQTSPRGMTVVAQQANPGREANVAHGHCLDRPAARRLVLGGAAARTWLTGRAITPV